MRKFVSVIPALKSKAVVVVAPLVCAVSTLMPMVSHASASAVSTDVSGALDIFTQGMAIFGEYPMNLYIGGSLLCMGLGVFGVGKAVARR